MDVEDIQPAEQLPAVLAPAAAVTVPDADSESDEWEYEYSTTETETFLLTLDLTNPDLNHDRPRRVKQGPLRTRWINPGLGRNRPGKFLKPQTYSTISGTLLDEAQNEGDEPEVDEDVEDDAADNDGQEDDGASQANLQKEIQIVDLHSENPLITYNGSAFSCRWASHVGTELLFKAHERDSTIPILRRLNGGVDLLAVNQARIISDPLELQPRKRKRSPDRAFVRGSHISHTKYLIPIGAHASARRKDQAVFLERMINMKVERGETDAVTVVAEKRLSNNRWKARIKEMRDKERAGLKKVIDNASNKEESQEFQIAKQRLQAMDEEDGRVSNLQPSLGKRRGAARLLRQGSRAKNADDGDEGEEVQSPAPRVDKPKRGRPPKTLYPVKRPTGAAFSHTAPMLESVAEGAPAEEAGEAGVANGEQMNVSQGQTPILHTNLGEDVVEEEFYSAQEGT